MKSAKVKDYQRWQKKNFMRTEKQLWIRSKSFMIRKISKVIQPIPLDPSSIPSEPLVDITLVNDWKFREGQWCRRCLIVAGDRPQHLRSHQWDLPVLSGTIRYSHGSYSLRCLHCIPPCGQEGRHLCSHPAMESRASTNGHFIGFWRSAFADTEMLHFDGVNMFLNFKRGHKSNRTQVVL